MYSLPMLLSILASHPLLAAGNNRIAQMGSRFKDSESRLDLTGLLTVLGGMLALVLVCWCLSYWHARRQARIVNSPRLLFRELCHVHGLNHTERELLQEIAQWHELTDPVQLFIEPQRFQPREMHEVLNCEAEVTELQARLFAGESTSLPKRIQLRT